MGMDFPVTVEKLSGLGNDFLVIENPPSGVGDWPATARRLCDRTSGIGADGLLLLGNSGGESLTMKLYNSDGSVAEMSGNGIRCLAQAAHRSSGRTSSVVYQIAIDASRPRVGCDLIDDTRGSPGRAMRGLSETPDAIPAHLGHGTIRVVQLHGQRFPTRVPEQEQSVGADSRRSIAQPTRSCVPVTHSTRRVLDHEEIVAETRQLLDRDRKVHAHCLVEKLSQHGCDFRDGIFIHRDPTDAGIATEPPLLAHGELARVDDDVGDGLIQRALPM